MSNMTVVILKGAKNAIEHFGWIKGASGNEGSGFCATGALGYATPEPGASYTDEATTFLNKVAQSRGISSGIVTYNDQPSTSKADILSAYDEAIALAEASSV